MISEANTQPAALRLPGPVANIILGMVSLSDVIAVSAVCRYWHWLTEQWTAAVEHFAESSEDHERLRFLINFVIPKSAHSLRSLSLTNMGLYDSEMPAIAAALAHCTSLRTLDLSDNHLETAWLSVLASILPHLPNLMSLKIARYGQETPFSSLAPALLHCSKLEVLEATLAMYGSDTLRT